MLTFAIQEIQVTSDQSFGIHIKLHFHQAGVARDHTRTVTMYSPSEPDRVTNGQSNGNTDGRANGMSSRGNSTNGGEVTPRSNVQLNH